MWTIVANGVLPGLFALAGALEIARARQIAGRAACNYVYSSHESDRPDGYQLVVMATIRYVAALRDPAAIEAVRSETVASLQIESPNRWVKDCLKRPLAKVLKEITEATATDCCIWGLDMESARDAFKLATAFSALIGKFANQLNRKE